MLAIQTTAPRTRKRAHPALRDCACGARYHTFRGAPTTGDARWTLLLQATHDEGYGAQADGGVLDRESEARRTCGAGAAMVLAGQMKRAAWEATHGPGLCHADMLDDEQVDAALDRDFSEAGGADAPF